MLKKIQYKAGKELDMLIAKEITCVDLNCVPKYSTDDTEAFKLLKEFRQNNSFCCIDIHSDHSYNWNIKFTPTNELQNEEHHVFLSFSGFNFAEIICNAILEANRYLLFISFNLKLNKEIKY